MAVRWSSLAAQVGRLAVREGPRLLRQVQRSRRAAAGQDARPQAQPATRPEPPGGRRPARTRTAPPAGRQLVYAPDRDGRADPGEVVWTWVTYEDDPSRGKDRPVLVVGREDDALLGLMLSSQSERAGQRGWLALGPGAWDAEQRPSWVRLDRVLEVAEDGIRREGAVLDRERFDQVAAALRDQHGWA